MIKLLLAAGGIAILLALFVVILVAGFLFNLLVGIGNLARSDEEKARDEYLLNKPIREMSDVEMLEATIAKQRKDTKDSAIFGLIIIGVVVFIIYQIS